MDEKVRAIRPEDVAKLYGLNTGSLANWRYQKIGPKYYKVGRKVVYLVADIERFIQQNPVLTKDSIAEDNLAIN